MFRIQFLACQQTLLGLHPLPAVQCNSQHTSLQLNVHNQLLTSQHAINLENVGAILLLLHDLRSTQILHRISLILISATSRPLCILQCDFHHSAGLPVPVAQTTALAATGTATG